MLHSRFKSVSQGVRLTSLTDANLGIRITDSSYFEKRYGLGPKQIIMTLMLEAISVTQRFEQCLIFKLKIKSNPV